MIRPRIYCTADLDALPTRRQRERRERLIGLAMFGVYLLMVAFAGVME